LGWDPLEPSRWAMPDGTVVDPLHLEHATAHVRGRLDVLRWEELAGRRADFGGAGSGVNEEETFRGPRRALGAGGQGVFGRYACIISGGTWTNTRRQSAGFGGDGTCQVCHGVRETPLHRWWDCPRWDAARPLGAPRLRRKWIAARGEPRCLWECGILPAGSAQEGPPPPPAGPTPQEPACDIRVAPGTCIYTDASAIRPKETFLRRAACSLWVGHASPLNAAWALPGPVQTVYRAELYAVVVAAERVAGGCVVVTDCLGVAQGAQRVLKGETPSAVSRHADLWARLNTVVRGNPGRLRDVRWVPSHQPPDSDRITARDREGNDEADKLARRMAERIGPTVAQQEAYDRKVALLRAVQRSQSAVLEAAIREGAANPDGRHGARRGRLAAGGETERERARGSAVRPLGPSELRTWGPHLVRASPAGGCLCTLCGRHATSHAAQRAMAKLRCRDRPGLRPRVMGPEAWEDWNSAIVVRWQAGDISGHNGCIYFSTGCDGRHLCLTCGRHCVKRVDLIRKRCEGQPSGPQGQQALEDAAAGLALKRRAVRSDARHPSGATLAAAGVRAPGHDARQIPRGERPLGPAHPLYVRPGGAVPGELGHPGARPGEGPPPPPAGVQGGPGPGCPLVLRPGRSVAELLGARRAGESGRQAGPMPAEVDDHGVHGPLGAGEPLTVREGPGGPGEAVGTGPLGTPGPRASGGSTGAGRVWPIFDPARGSRASSAPPLRVRVFGTGAGSSAGDPPAGPMNRARVAGGRSAASSSRPSVLSMLGARRPRAPD
jgi:hypothetical protein